MGNSAKPAAPFSKAHLNISDDELRLFFENMISPFSYYRMVYDEEGNPVDYIIIAVNRAFEKETGTSREEVIGKNTMALFPKTEHYWVEILGRVAKTGVSEDVTEYSETFQKWYSLRAYSPKTDYVAVTVTDISLSVNERESLATAEQALKTQLAENYRLLHEEPITGLPNRGCLYEAFQMRIQEGQETRRFALAIFTPDNLAEILASYGSVLSDRIMNVIARRVEKVCMEDDGVFSMTGTDFVMMIGSHCDTKRTHKALLSAQKAIVAPLDVDGNIFSITASCGVACFPEDGKDRDELIMKANLALYQAKKSGVSITYFNEQIAQKLMRRITIRNAMPKALENKEFVLYFQPQVQAETGCLLGFEALLRWHNAELHYPMPLEFIPVAEESRLILPLGAWVLKSACKTLRQINEHYHTNYYVAVNVSGVQLFEDGFIDQVLAVLEETSILPEQLELEVTESVLLNRELNAIGKLNKLFDHGVRIALDDFGTGYSSLSHLKDLEISTLKIDKSFIQDPRAGALTEMMVRLGHLLEAQIVAEGVETKEQQAFARILGCERIQGFLESRPLSLGDLKRFIETKNCE